MHFFKPNKVNHKVQLNEHVGYASNEFANRLAANPRLIEDIFNIRNGAGPLKAERVLVDRYYHVLHDSVWKFSMDGRDYCVKFTWDNQNDEKNAGYFLTLKLAEKYCFGLVKIANCHAGILDKKNGIGILLVDYYPYEKWGNISHNLSVDRENLFLDIVDRAISGSLFIKKDRKQLMQDWKKIRAQASALPPIFERLKYYIFKFVGGIVIGIGDIRKQHAFLNSEKKIIMYDLQGIMNKKSLERAFIID